MSVLWRFIPVLNHLSDTKPSCVFSLYKGEKERVPFFFYVLYVSFRFFCFHVVGGVFSFLFTESDTKPNLKWISPRYNGGIGLFSGVTQNRFKTSHNRNNSIYFKDLWFCASFDTGDTKPVF